MEQVATSCPRADHHACPFAPSAWPDPLHHTPGHPAGAKRPPYVFFPILFPECAILFGKSPFEFLEKAYENYGL